MNPDNRRRDKSNNNRITKAIAAMPIAGIAIAASLLLGLALISSYQQPVIAQQQNMTGGGGGNATSTGAAGGGSQAEVMFHLGEVRKALENNDVQSAMMHLDLAMNLLGGGAGTQGNMTSSTGSTSSMG